MKVKSAFEDPRTGQMLAPGQNFDEKGLDKEEVERLKEAGYIADGAGYKEGEKPDYDKMSSAELVAVAQSKGIDTGSLRNRDKLMNAIKAKEAPQAPPAGDQKQATVTFGPKHGTATVEDKTVSEEDRKKQLEERSASRKEQEANRLGGGGGRKAAPASDKGVGHRGEK